VCINKNKEKVMVSYNPNFYSGTEERTLLNLEHGVWLPVPDVLIRCELDIDKPAHTGICSAIVRAPSHVTDTAACVALVLYALNPFAGLSKTLDTVCNPVYHLTLAVRTANGFAIEMFHKLMGESNSYFKSFFAFLASTAIFAVTLAIETAHQAFQYTKSIAHAIYEDACDFINRVSHTFNVGSKDDVIKIKKGVKTEEETYGINKKISQPLSEVQKLLDSKQIGGGFAVNLW
jgi:hypothetical protein